MKKIVIICLTLLATTGTYAQVQINPQVGLTLMGYTNPPDGVDYTAESGFLIGGDFRFGDRFQWQPGIFYMATTTLTKYVGTSGDPVESDITHSWLRLKGLVSYKLIDGDVIRLRANGGPSYDFLLKAEDEDGNDVKDNLASGSLNLNLGLGIDFYAVTFDLGYSIGLTKAFKDDAGSDDSKFAGLYITAGFVFGTDED